MTLLDRLLVIAGYAHWRVTGRGRNGTAATVLIWLMVAAIVVPVLVVAVTPQPQEATLEELQLNLVTSPWVRVKGDLQEADPWPDGTLRYALREPGNEALILTVVSDAPLATGLTEITGRTSGGRPVQRSFGVIRADVPYVPPRNDPWFLLAVPAVLGFGLVAGGRAGYPVLRPDRHARAGSAPLAPGEQVTGRWSGRIGDLEVGFPEERACRLSAAVDADVTEVTIVDEHGTRTVSVHRSARKQPLRICSRGGCVPGVEAHGPGLDLLIGFDEQGPRDRLAAALQAPSALPATAATR